MRCHLEKVVRCEENDLPNLHGSDTITMALVIVPIVCGQSKIIGSRAKILKEFGKADGRKQVAVGRIIAKDEGHCTPMVVLRGIKTQMAYCKYVSKTFYISLAVV